MALNETLSFNQIPPKGTTTYNPCTTLPSNGGCRKLLARFSVEKVTPTRQASVCVLACVRVRPRPEVMESFLLAFTKHPPSQDPLFLCGTGGRRTPPPRGTKQGERTAECRHRRCRRRPRFTLPRRARRSKMSESSMSCRVGMLFSAKGRGTSRGSHCRKLKLFIQRIFQDSTYVIGVDCGVWSMSTELL